MGRKLWNKMQLPIIFFTQNWKKSSWKKQIGEQTNKKKTDSEKSFLT